MKETALHNAARNGNLFAVSKLLEKDASLNFIPNAFNNLAIHIATAYGHTNIINEIQQRLIPTFDVNVKGYNSQTPLHVAILNMKYSVVELLIDLNADCNITDANGNTALHAACKLYNSCCSMKSMKTNDCQTASNHGIKIKEIQESLFITHHNKCYNLALIFFLIKNGNANINAINNDGKSPLSLVGKASKVSILMKSLSYEKLQRFRANEKLGFDVNDKSNNANSMDTGDIQSARSQDMCVENLVLTISEINKGQNDVPIATTNTSEKCGCTISNLKDKVQKLENEMAKLIQEIETLKMHQKGETTKPNKDNHSCEMCNNSSSYSLLCGHKLCDQCYEDNNC
ncbi:E3 ubiquitin-protein ligase MIB2-like protein, partial [Leptotrombidium deliense]